MNPRPYLTHGVSCKRPATHLVCPMRQLSLRLQEFIALHICECAPSMKLKIICVRLLLDVDCEV